MNVRILIDKVVQQSAVLIAQLATSGGLRAPLANVSDQLFLDLARELDHQGVSRKVSSDMFGMALRAYLKKIQRLTESETDVGRSLWEAVLAFIVKKGGVTRAEVMQRFRLDDERQVKGVLHDLTESALIVTTTSRTKTSYVAGAPEDLGQSSKALAELLWAIVFREGPIAHSVLLKHGGAAKAACDQAIADLLAKGRIEDVSGENEPEYVSQEFVVPRGEGNGWEAAVFDHLQALVRTMSHVLRASSQVSGPEPPAGGFTYSIDVWPEHPLADEVFGTLEQMRSKLSALRKRVEEHNATETRPQSFQEVVLYGGQSVRERDGVGRASVAPAAPTRRRPSSSAPARASREKDDS